MALILDHLDCEELADESGISLVFSSFWLLVFLGAWQSIVGCPSSDFPSSLLCLVWKSTTVCLYFSSFAEIITRNLSCSLLNSYVSPMVEKSQTHRSDGNSYRCKYGHDNLRSTSSDVGTSSLGQPAVRGQHRPRERWQRMLALSSNDGDQGFWHELYK